MKAAVHGLQAIFRPGFDYVRAGVMLLDLWAGSTEQHELDLEPAPQVHGDLMGTMDKLNDRYGRGTVLLASAGLKWEQRTWVMKQSLLTPAYTTKWDDLPTARA